MDYVEYPATNYTFSAVNNTRYSIRVALNNTAGLGEYSSPPFSVVAAGVGKFTVSCLV